MILDDYERLAKIFWEKHCYYYWEVGIRWKLERKNYSILNVNPVYLSPAQIPGIYTLHKKVLRKLRPIHETAQNI